MQSKPSPRFITCLLGVLSVISPFSIDMYLPAFPQVAKDLKIETVVVSLTLSSYFIGMALGQILYGPLLDRFGRKKPLCIGLLIYILTSIACAFAPNIESLVVLRFIQAIGGCAAGVASLAMVRDFFSVEQSAKIFSRLFLFIAVSPLLAPTVGGAVALAFGWKSVFFVLAAITAVILGIIIMLLPEAHQPDAGISLKPGPVIREYIAILRHPRFFTCAFAGAFSFAGLFTYVAGSPIIFMDGFQLSAGAYSAVFALLACGFIGSSQMNVQLLKRYSSEQLFFRILIVQASAGVIFMAGSWLRLYGLEATLFLFFVFLSCAGLTYPNAAALALSPFSRNAGSASALLGFLQLGVGAFISTFISLTPPTNSFPIIAILGVTSVIGLCILIIGRKRAHDAAAE